MRLADYLDKGASLGAEAPCLTTDGVTATYAETQALSHRVAAALVGCGVIAPTHVRALRELAPRVAADLAR